MDVVCVAICAEARVPHLPEKTIPDLNRAIRLFPLHTSRLGNGSSGG